MADPVPNPTPVPLVDANGDPLQVVEQGWLRIKADLLWAKTKGAVYSRTVIVNLVAMGLAYAADQADFLKLIFGEKQYAMAMIIMGAINIVLRYDTSKPLQDKSNAN